MSVRKKSVGSGRFHDDGLVLGGDSDDALPVGFRFRREGPDVWFGVFAAGHERAVFSGIVGQAWPAQLRTMADFVEQRLKEAERLGDG